MGSAVGAGDVPAHSCSVRTALVWGSDFHSNTVILKYIRKNINLMTSLLNHLFTAKKLSHLHGKIRSSGKHSEILGQIKACNVS